MSQYPFASTKDNRHYRKVPTQGHKYTSYTNNVKWLLLDVKIYRFYLSCKVYPDTSWPISKSFSTELHSRKISHSWQIYRAPKGTSIHTKMSLLLPCLVFSMTEWSCQFHGNYLGLLEGNFILLYINGWMNSSVMSP